MKVVGLSTGSPQEQANVAKELRIALEAVIEDFCDRYPQIPCVTMLGVLRIVEWNFIESID